MYFIIPFFYIMWCYMVLLFSFIIMFFHALSFCIWLWMLYCLYFFVEEMSFSVIFRVGKILRGNIWGTQVLAICASLRGSSDGNRCGSWSEPGFTRNSRAVKTVYGVCKLCKHQNQKGYFKVWGYDFFAALKYKKSPTGPTQRTPQPEYPIALATCW